MTCYDRSGIGRMARSGLLALLLMAFLCHSVTGQERFENKGQVWQIMNNIDALVELRTDSVTGILSIDTLNKNLPSNLECLAYRHTDGLLYAMHSSNRTLYTLDRNGEISQVTTLAIDPEKVYLSGAITPDGRYYTVIGSDNIRDLVAVTIDLQSPVYAAETKALSTNGLSGDIAYHPFTGALFGYDMANRGFTEIDLNSGRETIVAAIPDNADIGGVYFTPFGELMGFGNTQFGVASAVFEANTDLGTVAIRNSGGVYFPRDIASNAQTVDVRLKASPREGFPCEDVTYTLTFANSTGGDLPVSGFDAGVSDAIALKKVLRNRYDVDMTIDPDAHGVEMDAFTLKAGVDSILISAEIEDVPEGRYKMQGLLSGLPEVMGRKRLTDDPLGRAKSDSSLVRVIRVDDDSVFLNRFGCLGEEVVLDASGYGNNIIWSTGATTQELTVSTPGEYKFTASTGCNKINGIFEVTFAQCPFTIALMHDIEPRQTFPCSEVIFTYIFENDAGTVQKGLSFTDTLTPGFEFIEVVEGMVDGKIVSTGSPAVLKIEDLTLEVGYDTLIARVLVGNLTPAVYGNRSILFDLPSDVGTHRYSDDPRTLYEDSTYMEVLGVDTDSLFVELDMCNGDPVVLDASRYGVSFLWEDGSANPELEVYEPGVYGVTVFDGCDESYVTYYVSDAPGLQVYADSTRYRVRLSEEVILRPMVRNEGDSLFVVWRDPLDTSLSCLYCLDPETTALDDITYAFYASNGICADSIDFTLYVDDSRRLYMPNVFTPNGDGVNDQIMITSPDYGIVEELVVQDRWGAVLHSARNIPVNTSQAGWDGRSRGDFVAAGVYTWSARVRFYDGEIEWFSGQVTLLR